MYERVGALLTAAGEAEKKADASLSQALYRMNNEIEHDLHGLDPDVDAVQSKLFQYAAMQYAAIILPKTESKGRKETGPCSPHFIRKLRHSISAVFLGDGEIQIRLTDGRTVEKENTESGENREVGAGHPADSDQDSK